MALLEINAAITQLIGGETRSSEEERSFMHEIFKDFACAAERCRLELLALPDGKIILWELANWTPGLRRRSDTNADLSRVPACFATPDLAVETISNLSKPLPDPLDKFSKFAHRCDRDLSAYLSSYRRAFAFLLEEARAKRLDLYARRQERVGLDILSPTELAIELIIEDCGGRLRQKYPGTREFYNAHVDVGEFQGLLRNKPLTASETRQVMLQKAEAWFEAQASEYHALPEKTQVMLLQRAFPDLIGHRQLIRDFKAERKRKTPKS